MISNFTETNKLQVNKETCIMKTYISSQRTQDWLANETLAQELN